MESVPRITLACEQALSVGGGGGGGEGGAVLVLLSKSCHRYNNIRNMRTCFFFFKLATNI